MRLWTGRADHDRLVLGTFWRPDLTGRDTDRANLFGVVACFGKARFGTDKTIASGSILERAGVGFNRIAINRLDHTGERLLESARKAKSGDLAVMRHATQGMSIDTGGGGMLVLHIGTGKAGSTTIQSFLKESRDQLAFGQLEAFGIGNAWKIAAASGTDKSRNYWELYKKPSDGSDYDLWRSAFWQDVSLQYARSGYSDIIASSEYIYGQLGDSHSAIGGLRDQLDGIFGNIKIIIYFRNQVDYVKSAYAQRIKGSAKETIPFEEFISNLDEMDIPIHYADRLRIWSSVFGKMNICPVVFDRRNFPDGNLIEDFCHRAGLPAGNDLGAWANVSKNVSPPVSQLEALRLLNKVGVKSGGTKKIAAYIMGHLQPKTEYTTEFDNAIIDRVSEGNKWLNDTFFSELAIRLPVSS